MDMDAPAGDGLTRAEGLWFADCGLIIQAEKTLFRVSRDLLAAQSSVFRDMASLPPQTPEVRMEGCPDTENQHVVIAGLARKIGADWILPSAFYRMCQTAEEHHVMTTSHLGDSHRAEFMQGVRFLETKGVTDILDFLWCLPVCRDVDPTDCNMTREENYRRVIKNAHYDPAVISTMPLELWREADWRHLYECTDCYSGMRREHQAARLDLWDRLPGIFGLPDWAELEKMKEVALA
ncbi:hypothetical protein DFH06DRAFT_1152393 [Mycena polygramma]|nr:hypothetical protein DFH06DRAFT_1152393 [Mycena polygramma]